MNLFHEITLLPHWTIGWENGWWMDDSIFLWDQVGALPPHFSPPIEMRVCQFTLSDFGKTDLSLREKSVCVCVCW